MTRYSGLRLRSHFVQQGLEIQNLARQILTETGQMAALLQQAPALVDDRFRGMDELSFWCQAVLFGEVIICREQYRTGRIVGTVLISSVKIGACADVNFLVGDGHVAAACREILQYIFKPAPAGLGCLKARSWIHPDNREALQLAEVSGFVPRVVLPCEASFHGQLTSMLLVELLNPAVFSTGEELVNGELSTTGEPANGDVAGTVCPDVRSGAPGTMDIDNGDATGELDAGGYDRNRENIELLQSFNMGGPAVSGSSGREPGLHDDKPEPAGDGAGVADSKPDDSGSTAGRRLTPRKHAAKRGK